MFFRKKIADDVIEVDTPHEAKLLDDMINFLNVDILDSTVTYSNGFYQFLHKDGFLKTDFNMIILNGYEVHHTKDTDEIFGVAYERIKYIVNKFNGKVTKDKIILKKELSLKYHVSRTIDTEVDILVKDLKIMDNYLVLLCKSYAIYIFEQCLIDIDDDAEIYRVNFNIEITDKNIKNIKHINNIMSELSTFLCLDGLSFSITLSYK